LRFLDALSLCLHDFLSPDKSLFFPPMPYQFLLFQNSTICECVLWRPYTISPYNVGYHFGDPPFLSLSTFVGLGKTSSPCLFPLPRQDWVDHWSIGGRIRICQHLSIFRRGRRRLFSLFFWFWRSLSKLDDDDREVVSIFFIYSYYPRSRGRCLRVSAIR